MTTEPDPSDEVFLLPTLRTAPVLLRLLATIYRRLPLLGGHLRLTPAWVRARLDAIDGDVVATLRNGLQIPVDPRDYNGRELFLFGSPNRRIVALCRALLRPGNVFLDIGANHGSVGLLCLDRVVPDGKIHLVEPQPELNARIRVCLAAREGLPVTLHEMALWNKDGEFSLARPRGHSGAASLVEDAMSDQDTDHIRVPVRDIAIWTQEVAGDRPCGAKVDIEGAETVVVPFLLGLSNIRFVVFECKDKESFAPIWAAAREAGRTIFGLERTSLQLRVSPIIDIDEFGRHTDYVAFHTCLGRTPKGSLHPSEFIQTT